MSQKKVLGYKIRHTKTGLYLASALKGGWTKIGKVWPRIEDPFRSINRRVNSSVGRSNKRYEEMIDDFPNWEMVELTEERAYPVLFLINKIKYTSR